MSKSRPPKRLTIKELVKHKLSPQIEAVLGELQHGTFGDCHTDVCEKFGIWIPELVPVFEKLDAMLIFRKDPVA